MLLHLLTCRPLCICMQGLLRWMEANSIVQRMLRSNLHQQQYMQEVWCLNRQADRSKPPLSCPHFPTQPCLHTQTAAVTPPDGGHLPA